MGNLAAKLTRPLRNYNVDNRAAKVLERRQKVAVPPPNYPSTVERLSRFRQEHPEYLEAQKNRDEKLNEHLKKVYVESTGSLAQTTSTKPQPINRKPPPETDMGALEQIFDIPAGRTTLKTAIGFIGQHRSDPQNFTASRIAADNNLDENSVQNVLQHFKMFHLHIPQAMYDGNKNMKKIIEGQLKHASSIATPFVLPKKKKKDQIPQIDVPEPKT